MQQITSGNNLYMGYIHLLYPHCEYISPGWFSLNDENDGIHPPRKNR